MVLEVANVLVNVGEPSGRIGAYGSKNEYAIAGEHRTEKRLENQL